MISKLHFMPTSIIYIYFSTIIAYCPFLAHFLFYLPGCCQSVAFRIVQTFDEGEYWQIGIEENVTNKKLTKLWPVPH